MVEEFGIVKTWQGYFSQYMCTEMSKLRILIFLCEYFLLNCNSVFSSLSQCLNKILVLVTFNGRKLGNIYSELPYFKVFFVF